MFLAIMTQATLQQVYVGRLCKSRRNRTCIHIHELIRTRMLVYPRFYYRFNVILRIF